VEFGDHVTVGPGVAIGAGARVSSGVRIYPGTRIGTNTVVLENAVLGRPTIIPPESGLVRRELGAEMPPLLIGSACVIGANVVLYRGTTVGDRCIICDLTSVRENCSLGDDVLLGRCVTVQVNTRIGARTKIMDTTHLPGDMVVEEDVFISTHVCGASENSMGRGDPRGRWNGPRIRRGAYVSANATLLPDIEIGEDAVVGAGAVVTRSVAPRTLVLGVPAREVRTLGPRDV
jgi:acetyltransferase-like isoleucine patch superfamily enzyme